MLFNTKTKQNDFFTALVSAKKYWISEQNKHTDYKLLPNCFNVHVQSII